jgi:hypothetical protein
MIDWQATPEPRRFAWIVILALLLLGVTAGAIADYYEQHPPQTPPSPTAS